MKAILPHPILSLMLLVIWLLLSNSVGVGNLLLGALLGWSIPLFTARFWEAEVHIRRPLTLLRFFATVLYDILVANVIVAALVIGPARNIRPGFIEMPLRVRGRVAISLLANTISLTPGTLSAFLSKDERTLVIHGLQIDDPEAIVTTIRERYEWPLLMSLEPDWPRHADTQLPVAETPAADAEAGDPAGPGTSPSPTGGPRR